MRRAVSLWLAMAGVSIGTSLAPRAALAAEATNIVVILADDLGWADVGWHGRKVRPPRLDSLAAAGAKLEQ